MSSVKIIIADEDDDYLIPLKICFLECYGDKIDLETITNKHYMDEFFFHPQTADILVVSEQWYEPALQRHAIGTLICLSECEEAVSDTLKDITLFKYVTTAEVVAEIMHYAHEHIGEIIEKKHKSKIVMVCSASGGVGKTTLALGVASALTKQNYHVVYVDAKYLQSITTIFPECTPIKDLFFYSALLSEHMLTYEILEPHLYKDKLTILRPFKAPLSSLNVDYDIFCTIALALQCSQQYDYIIVDTDSVFNDSLFLLMDTADKVVLLTTQKRESVLKTKMLCTYLEDIQSEKYSVICNDSTGNCDDLVVDGEQGVLVHDYIPHFKAYDEMEVLDFGKRPEIQRISLLL